MKRVGKRSSNPKFTFFSNECIIMTTVELVISYCLLCYQTPYHRWILTYKKDTEWLLPCQWWCLLCKSFLSCCVFCREAQDSTHPGGGSLRPGCPKRMNSSQGSSAPREKHPVPKKSRSDRTHSRWVSVNSQWVVVDWLHLSLLETVLF